MFQLLLQIVLPLLARAACTIKREECYRDHSLRILGKANVAQGPITREFCAQLCHDSSFTLAGTESDGECYCGHHFNYFHFPFKVNIDECYYHCNGDFADTCGGEWRIRVFEFECSGPRVPQPPEMPMMVNPCRNSSSPFSKMPFCNATLPIDVRVEDAVGRMTLREKISQLVQSSGPVASLGLPAHYNWWNEATGGVCGRRHGQTTHFAYPITTGMSFNRSLWRFTGAQIGREARAAMNEGNAYSTLWTPVVNLAREPRWGRNIETPGEDPYLTSEYAEQFVKGIQEAPEDPLHLQASACCKHYVANELENTKQPDGEHYDRNHVDTRVSMQDLVDSYMRPFQACVEKGGVSSLMCSYNAVNGKPSCANDWLLQTVARDNWGFDGAIVSDCDADSDVFFSHHYTATADQTVRDVLRAGTDVDCGDFVSTYAMSALSKGLITEEDINERVKMALRVRMRLSHFDPVGPLDGIGSDVICSESAIELSMEGVRQSAALLKNLEDTLPLDRERVGTVAVIGPNALLSKSDASYYGPTSVCNDKFWTLVDALKVGTTRVVSTLGVPSTWSEDTSGIPKAVEMAKTADTVILAVGTDLSWAREGHDALNITFTSAQSQLIEEVAAAAKRRVVVVTMTATPLDLSALFVNPKVGAILHVGQPSVTILGVADVLYGDRSPAGRMIQTVYPAPYQDQISIFDFGMRPGASQFARPDCKNRIVSLCPKGTNPGRTHRFFIGKPVVPFGFGLSYTTFTYSLAARPASSVSLVPLLRLLRESRQKRQAFVKSTDAFEVARSVSWHQSASFAVNVTNTGSKAADDVVLGFLTPPGAGQNGVPLKILFGFERVHVRTAETVTVRLHPSLLDFAQADGDGNLYAAFGNYSVTFGVAETSAHGMGYLEAGILQATSQADETDLDEITFV